MSLFFANCGFHPHYDFELDIWIDATEEGETQTAAK